MSDMGWKKHHTIHFFQNSVFKQTTQRAESSVQRGGTRRATRIVKQSPRHGGAKAIGKIIVGLVGTIVGQRRLDESTLLMQWTVIVGHQIAEICSPIRLTFYRNTNNNGILQIKVQEKNSLVVLQYSSPLIIERINAYFNRPIVGQIRIIQGSIPRKVPTTLLLSHKNIVLQPDEEAALLAEVAQVNDDALREALIRLGRQILMHHHQSQQGNTDKLDPIEGESHKA